MGRKGTPFPYLQFMAQSVPHLFLQCFDTVGWVTWPVTRPRYDLCVWW